MPANNKRLAQVVLPFLLVCTSNAFSPLYVGLGVARQQQTHLPLRSPARGIAVARNAATGSEEKKLKQDMEEVFSAPGFGKPQLEEDLFDGIANSGKKEVQELGEVTKDETEQLKKKLLEDIDLAMKGAEVEMLEEYDKKTSEILESMKRDRDIIRKETETIAAFQEELANSRMWWKKGKGGNKKASPLSPALILAWTFGLAAANEIYTGVNSDEGISVIGGCKAAADVVVALLSAKIASKNSAPDTSDDTTE